MSLALSFCEAELAPDLAIRFEIVANKVVELFAFNGYQVRAFLPGLPFFSKLNLYQQQQVLRHIEFYLEVCIEHTNDGYLLRDSLSFTWRALSKLKLSPPADLFSRIVDTDIIEVYSSTNVQLFRNLKFFDFCTYTLEELYSIEWFHLFDRDAQLGPLIMEDIQLAQSGQFPSGLKPRVGPHLLKEANSAERLAMDYNLKWIAPLNGLKEISGFIVLEEATLRGN